MQLLRCKSVLFAADCFLAEVLMPDDLLHHAALAKRCSVQAQLMRSKPMQQCFLDVWLDSISHWLGTVCGRPVTGHPRLALIS